VVCVVCVRACVRVRPHRYKEEDGTPVRIDHALFLDATPGEQGHNCFVRHHTPRQALMGTTDHWRIHSSAIVNRKLEDGTPLSDHCGVSLTLVQCKHQPGSSPGLCSTRAPRRSPMSVAGAASPSLQPWEVAATPALKPAQFRHIMTDMLRQVEMGIMFVRRRRRSHWWRMIAGAVALVLCVFAFCVTGARSHYHRGHWVWSLTRALVAVLDQSLGLGWRAMNSLAIVLSAVLVTVEFVLLTFVTKMEEMALLETRRQMQYDIAVGTRHIHSVWLDT